MMKPNLKLRKVKALTAKKAAAFFSRSKPHSSTPTSVSAPKAPAGDCLTISIGHDMMALKETIRALESGFYSEASTKVHITKGKEGPQMDKLYSRLLVAVGQLPNLQELSIQGDVNARVNAPILPVKSLKNLLQGAAQTICKVHFQNIILLTRKESDQLIHPEISNFYKSLKKLQCLQEFDITSCFQIESLNCGIKIQSELSIASLLGPLASIPSLKRVALSQKRTEGLEPSCLQSLFQSCPCLEELLLTGFSVEESDWDSIVPSILQHARKLKRLHLEHCCLGARSLDIFLQLLGPESPLEDFEFMPILTDDMLGLGHTRQISATPQGEVTWKRLLCDAIPTALESNTKLQRLSIKAKGDVNLFVPIEFQQPWLDLIMEQGRNNSLIDFGFSRDDGLCFHYEDEEMAAKFEHYQKLRQFGIRKLEAFTGTEEEEFDRTTLQVLGEASGDVSCLFHILQRYPSLCTAAGKIY
ncbi:expressed unknown protein [Seminavis robusta]|uniref:Uncharacterized protein n=1 Tax=Seminavis robusta TaxID=568900 RepID=A0A9N8E6Q6_9STRA|nr:expressed unknown protein [Seminavis robusta]|eukprot:Sro555_g165710.1 n/a (472) ;mRNA; f:33224-34639